MTSVNKTLDYCMHHKHTIVFGNLGRQPQLIANFLDTQYPQLDVLVLSEYLHYPEREHVLVNQPLAKCDILIYLEPPIDCTLSERESASRIWVFTSHLCFDVPATFEVISFHAYLNTPTIDMKHTSDLLKVQDASVSHYSVDLVKHQITDYFTVKVVSKRPEADLVLISGKPFPLLIENAYVILDVTPCRDVSEMFLTLLDLFDVLIWNKRYVERWVICFPPKKEPAFCAFTQRFIDKMTCYPKGLDYLKVTPFSREPISKNTDWSKIPTHKFFGYTVYAPTNEREVCDLHAQFDTVPIQHSVYVKDVPPSLL